jgi:hypothetical protein
MISASSFPQPISQIGFGRARLQPCRLKPITLRALESVSQLSAVPRGTRFCSTSALPALTCWANECRRCAAEAQFVPPPTTKLSCDTDSLAPEGSGGSLLRFTSRTVGRVAQGSAHEVYPWKRAPRLLLGCPTLRLPLRLCSGFGKYGRALSRIFERWDPARATILFSKRDGS